MGKLIQHTQLKRFKSPKILIALLSSGGLSLEYLQKRFNRPRKERDFWKEQGVLPKNIWDYVSVMIGIKINHNRTICSTSLFKGEIK